MTPERMLRAAALLRETAESLKLGHGLYCGDEFDWPPEDQCDACDLQARADHDEMLVLADDLTTLATALRR